MNSSNVTAFPFLTHANTTGLGCTSNMGEIVSSTIGFLIGLPMNSYVVWVIIADPTQTLVSCFFELNMCLGEILMGMLSPFNLAVWCDFNGVHKALHYIMYFFYTLILSGRPMFQTCICVERYVAVVYPVLFLKYRALRYRMVCSAVAWLIILACFLTMAIEGETGWNVFPFLILILILVKMFCFLAVLRALKQPQPGDGGRERERANQAKMRAFKIILVLLTSTIVQYVPLLLEWVLHICFPESPEVDLMNEIVSCIMMAVGFIQPLLFLQRTGKLPCKGTP